MCWYSDLSQLIWLTFVVLLLVLIKTSEIHLFLIIVFPPIKNYKGNGFDLLGVKLWKLIRAQGFAALTLRMETNRPGQMCHMLEVHHLCHNQCSIVNQ